MQFGKYHLRRTYDSGDCYVCAALLCRVCLGRKLSCATAAKGCTRASLQKITNKYIEALKKGKPSLMPLASQAKYIERRKEVPLGQGIWQTPLTVDFSRSFFDVDICESFTEIIHTSSDHPYVIGTRLKVVDNKIAEIESLVSDKNDWLFNAVDYLKYSSTEKWDIHPARKAQRPADLDQSRRATTSISFRITPPSTKCPGASPVSALRVACIPIPKMIPILPAPSESPREAVCR